MADPRNPQDLEQSIARLNKLHNGLISIKNILSTDTTHDARSKQTISKNLDQHIERIRAILETAIPKKTNVEHTDTLSPEESVIDIKEADTSKLRDPILQEIQNTESLLNSFKDGEGSLIRFKEHFLILGSFLGLGSGTTLGVGLAYGFGMMGNVELATSIIIGLGLLGSCLGGVTGSLRFDDRRDFQRLAKHRAICEELLAPQISELLESLDEPTQGTLPQQQTQTSHLSADGQAPVVETHSAAYPSPFHRSGPDGKQEESSSDDESYTFVEEEAPQPTLTP